VSQAEAGPADGDSDAGVPPGPEDHPSHDADRPGSEWKRRRTGSEAAGGAALGGPAWAGEGYSDMGRTPLAGPGGSTPVHPDRTPLYTDKTPLYTDKTPR
jgi:hypothetical protein